MCTLDKSHLGGVGLDAARSEESQPSCLRKMLFILCVTILQSTVWSGVRMCDCKGISHQFSTEDSTSLSALGGVGTGELEIMGHHNVVRAFEGGDIFCGT